MIRCAHVDYKGRQCVLWRSHRSPIHAYRPVAKARYHRLPATTRGLVAARSQGRCEARFTETCTGRGEHMHHVRLLSQGGQDVPENVLHVCHFCHERIHDRPLLAAERGLLARRETA